MIYNNLHFDIDSETWRSVIRRNGQPDLIPSETPLLDFCAKHSLPITNTFKHQRLEVAGWWLISREREIWDFLPQINGTKGWVNGYELSEGSLGHKKYLLPRWLLFLNCDQAWQSIFLRLLLNSSPLDILVWNHFYFGLIFSSYCKSELINYQALVWLT